VIQCIIRRGGDIGAGHSVNASSFSGAPSPKPKQEYPNSASAKGGRLSFSASHRPRRPVRMSFRLRLDDPPGGLKSIRCVSRITMDQHLHHGAFNQYGDLAGNGLRI
jgi:hypothetical protein